MKKDILNKIAAALAFVIGMMAMIAGGRVLLGIRPDYYVIDWLPVYNFVMGAASVFFTAIVIWRNGRLALSAALATLGLHAVVMFVLQTAYRAMVAPDSVQAMTVRLIVWVLIAGLLIVQRKDEKEKRE